MILILRDIISIVQSGDEEEGQIDEVVETEEVEDVAQVALAGLVELRVFALGAGQGGEPLALDIEDLGEESPGRSEFAGIEAAVSAFGATVTAGHDVSFQVGSSRMGRGA